MEKVRQRPGNDAQRSQGSLGQRQLHRWFASHLVDLAARRQNPDGQLARNSEPEPGPAGFTHPVPNASEDHASQAEDFLRHRARRTERLWESLEVASPVEHQEHTELPVFKERLELSEPARGQDNPRLEPAGDSFQPPAASGPDKAEWRASFEEGLGEPEE